jgi:hypothetical protein
MRFLFLDVQALNANEHHFILPLVIATLLGHISLLVVLVIDDNAFVD